MAAIGVENPGDCQHKDADTGDEPRTFPDVKKAESSSQAEPAKRVQAPPRDFTVPGAAATWWSRPALQRQPITAVKLAAPSRCRCITTAPSTGLFAGTGQVTVNGKQFLLTENQSTFYSDWRRAQPENGCIPLEVLEIQSGSYRRGRHYSVLKTSMVVANFFRDKRRMTQLTCFKELMTSVVNWVSELNEIIAYRGHAGEFLKPRKIVGGMCASKQSLKLALAWVNGRRYRCTGHPGLVARKRFTSPPSPRGGRRHQGRRGHNPMNYRHEAGANTEAISGDTSLQDIQRTRRTSSPPVDPARRETTASISVLLKVRRPPDGLRGRTANFTRPLKLVVNSGEKKTGRRA